MHPKGTLKLTTLDKVVFTSHWIRHDRLNAMVMSSMCSYIHELQDMIKGGKN